MAYIGTPPSNAFTSLLKQDFSTSATTGYTLDHAVNNANDIALFINFVRQEPTAAYSASGTTLTLTSATASTDDMYCVYLGQALQTVNPPNASVGLSQLTATGTKDSTTFLRGDNTFASAGGDNSPAFEATLTGSSQIINNASYTKIECNTEVYDTDNCYDNSTNYRFTPTTAGKYFVYGKALFDSTAGNMRMVISVIYKNGSALTLGHTNFHTNTSNDAEGGSAFVATVVDMNGTSDYLELYGYVSTVNNGTAGVDENERRTAFGAYKLIGV